MQQYEKYKDSGVDWIGQVPENWEIVRFKRLFNEKKKITDASLNSGSISFGEIIYKDDEKITEATKLSYQVLNSGEFLLNPLNMNYDLKSLRIGLSTINVVVSSGYIILQSKKGLNKNYYRWLLRMYDVVFMKTLGAGVRQTINYNDLADSYLVVPSLDEQQTIATFLDEKTSKIDQTIANKQKEIELLKERRQILIQTVVTKGLDENVKMKNSGVDWIGEIPAHWEVRKLKYLTEYFKGFAFSSTDFAEEGVPIVKASNIKNWTIENISSFISLDNQNSRFENFRLLEGDIIISTVGSKPIMRESAVGQLAIVNKEFSKSYLNQNTVCIRPKNSSISAYYLKYIFISNYMRSSFDKISLWIANQAYIEIDSILEICITLPPILEQMEILEYIESGNEKITKAIWLKQQEIEKLKEYKMVLIDNIVTGKMKVS